MGTSLWGKAALGVWGASGMATTAGLVLRNHLFLDIGLGITVLAIFIGGFGYLRNRKCVLSQCAFAGALISAIAWIIMSMVGWEIFMDEFTPPDH